MAEELELELDEDGRVSGEYTGCVDFGCRGIAGLMSDRLLASVRDDCVLLHAEERQARLSIKESGEEERAEEEGEVEEQPIEDCADLDGTFWVPAAENERPRDACLLERLAMEIFDYYTKSVGNKFDLERSGAEWWVQVREIEEPNVEHQNESGQPALKRQKTEMEESCEESEQDETVGESIRMHFDKDEALQALSGLYVCPALSTVTYLSNSGAPTLVMRKRYDNESGAIEDTQDPVLPKGASALLSYPFSGNHLCFDGRLLHGCPKELRGAVQSEKVRISFLVNIWIDHVPCGLGALPRQVAKKLNPAPCTRLALAWDKPARAIKAAPTQERVHLRVCEGGLVRNLDLPFRQQPANLEKDANMMVVFA